MSIRTISQTRSQWAIAYVARMMPTGWQRKPLGIADQSVYQSVVTRMLSYDAQAQAYERALNDKLGGGASVKSLGNGRFEITLHGLPMGVF